MSYQNSAAATTSSSTTSGIARRRTAVLEARSPLTGEMLCTVPDASERDVVEAVMAAKAAWPAWYRLGPRKRAEAILKLADRLVAEAERFAWLETANTGKPLARELCQRADGGRSAAIFRRRGTRAGRPHPADRRQHPELRHPRAARRRRHHRRVEFPAQHVRGQDRARDRSRKRRRLQARASRRRSRRSNWPG